MGCNGNNFQVFGTSTFGHLYNTSRDTCLGRTKEKAAKINDITHIKHLSMGVKSKANKAHLRNIQSALSRSHKATVKDVSDSEEEHYTP